MSGKVTKFLVEKLSKAINQKPHGGRGNSPPVPLGLSTEYRILQSGWILFKEV